MPEIIKIIENIMNANDRIAFNNRQLLDQLGLYSINLMASPGSGKTSFILSTINELPPWINLGVIEGDTAPVTIDADKISNLGKPVSRSTPGVGAIWMPL
jgi:hydrogenase nickel incorporation protein HypB